MFGRPGPTKATNNVLLCAGTTGEYCAYGVYMCGTRCAGRYDTHEQRHIDMRARTV